MVYTKISETIYNPRKDLSICSLILFYSINIATVFCNKSGKVIRNYTVSVKFVKNGFPINFENLGT